MPGPEVEVIERAPAQAAPSTMPMLESSSSHCTTAYVALPVCGSWRYLRASGMKDSGKLEDGVIGYQATTVQPAITQPMAAAALPSMMILPAVLSMRSTL